MEKHQDWEEIAIGLAVGFTAGLVVGILTAPEAGNSIRGRIINGASGLRQSAREILEGARSTLEQATEGLESLFGTPEEQLRHRLDELKSEIDKYDLSGA